METTVQQQTRNAVTHRVDRARSARFVLAERRRLAITGWKAP